MGRNYLRPGYSLEGGDFPELDRETCPNCGADLVVLADGSAMCSNPACDYDTFDSPGAIDTYLETEDEPG